MAGRPVVRLTVERTGAPVATHAVWATSLAARLRGWIGRARLRTGEGILLAPCRSIHTWFMRMPIDVAFLDAEHRVVGLSHGLAPWRISPVVWSARCVIELPSGTLQQAGVRVGDRIRIEPTALTASV